VTATEQITPRAGRIEHARRLGTRVFPQHEHLRDRHHRAGRLDHVTADDILDLFPALPFWPEEGDGKRGLRRRGAVKILNWLQSFPGDGWQERWRNSGADEGMEWISELIAEDPRVSKRDEILDGLVCLLCCRVVLPSYDFLIAYRAVTLFVHAREAVSPLVFARVEEAGRRRGFQGKQLAEALNVLSKIVLHTGKNLDELTGEDLFEIRAWRIDHRGRALSGIHAAWELLAEVGILPKGSTLRAALRAGQRPTAELVDRHQIKCQPIRDLLVRYLDERRPGLDYGSFVTIVGILAGNFWADIEQHHPGIATLDLPDDVAAAWKERMRYVVRGDGSRRPRKDHLSVLMQIRAFYLDMTEWALEDPSWAQWAAPSPVRRGDTDGMAKAKKAATAEIHQRIRERLPYLPALVDSAERHRHGQAALLATATATATGDTFEHAGITYRRMVYKSFARGETQRGRPTVVVEDVATGETIDVTRTEDEAFWAWAIIETLRHTGVRVEELLEITHLALISYQLPDSGEVVPLLQIVPSKNNEERLLLVVPELASVLATIIARIRENGRVPLVARYDAHERTTGPRLPHLFQRKHGWRQEVISPRTVQELLGDALERTGVTDRTGAPLRYTPHDFRRMFVTEAVTGGLPVHIAARLLGHRNLNTTQAYMAVFQDELIRSYRAFVDQRRALRPAAEYREPTDEEWREFQDHFQYRKVELGTCGRPYGTPCNHEHACIRCAMLRVDPRQKGRLAEIIANLKDRITEARANGWLGEVQGLQVSLDAAKAKMASLARAERNRQTGVTDLGMPIIKERDRG
jgi:site-specific recombinase XerC